jgi:BASS family bile acid:Na+ symporter
MAERLMQLDNIRLNFTQDGLFVLNITLFVIMFGVALDIKSSQVKEVFVKPKSALVGILSQFFVLPAVTFLLVYAIRSHISPGVALGMLLVAACPGGNISNFISALAKGNAALSVSLTAIATLAAIFMTPLNFALWGGLFNASSKLLVPIEINPMEMFKVVLLLLGLPIILGMYVNHRFPTFTKKIIKPIKVISLFIFAGYVFVALSANYDFFVKYIKLVFFLVLAHNALALLTGFSLATFFKLPRKNRRTISIETGIQNSGLALVLIFNPRIFPPDLATGGMAIIAAWWGIWHIFAGLGISGLWSLKELPVEE